MSLKMLTAHLLRMRRRSKTVKCSWTNLNEPKIQLSIGQMRSFLVKWTTKAISSTKISTKNARIIIAGTLHIRRLKPRSSKATNRPKLALRTN